MGKESVLYDAINLYIKARSEAALGKATAAKLYRSAAEKYRKSAEVSPENKEEYLNMAKLCEEKAAGPFVPCKSNESANIGTNEVVKSKRELGIEGCSFEEVIEVLNSLVGHKTIKEKISELVLYAKSNSGDDKNVGCLPKSFMFLGKPGTGKSTVAKIIAKIYHTLGFLQKGHVVEVGRGDLVGAYVGQTAIKAKVVCDRALGGVLYIDDAFNLYRDENDIFGREAVDYIIQTMKERPGELVVILEGYQEPMAEFIELIPSVKSEFGNIIEFEDYTGDEICEIFFRLCKKNAYKLSLEAETLVRHNFDVFYQNRNEFWGNARVSVNVLDLMARNQAMRLIKLKKSGVPLSPQSARIIEKEDIPDIMYMK